MIPEQKIYQARFSPTEVVQLRQTCFTCARAFSPGKYIAGQLPDIAFEMGLVEQLPPVRGKNAEIQNIQAPQ